MAADEERGQHKVLVTWVKHVRDLAYNVEDSLMDFSLLSEKKKSWWHSPKTVVERRRIAKEMKKLRAKVEDVSNRILRYCLIGDSSGYKHTVAEKQASIATAALFGINEARLAALEHEKSSEVDLLQLITGNSLDLRVVAVWGTGGELGKTSTIEEVYDEPDILKRFGFRAWIRLMHPFNPKEFLRNLVWQFYENFLDGLGKEEEGTSIGANVLMKMESMEQNELVHVFNTQVSCNSYLIVIDDLSTIVEWHCIKKYFPEKKKQSRIIVSTQQVEIASLCTEKPLSFDQTLYLFHGKNSVEQVGMSSASVAMFNIKETRFGSVEEKSKAMHASCTIQPILDSNEVTTTEKNTSLPTSEIREEYQKPMDSDEEKVFNSTSGKKFDRNTTLALDDEMLIGREKEKSIVIRLLGQPDNNQDCKVISIWGMGGLGKTTLARSIYRCQQLDGWKHAWATVLSPFNPEVLLRDLAFQLRKSSKEDPAGATATGAQKKSIAVMKPEELKEELVRLLKSQKCLVVLDDISSISEWEKLFKGCLDNARRIIVTTREKNIAEHCSADYGTKYSLEGLKDADAFDLFLKKCCGLPIREVLLNKYAEEMVNYCTRASNNSLQDALVSSVTL